MKDLLTDVLVRLRGAQDELRGAGVGVDPSARPQPIHEVQALALRSLHPDIAAAAEKLFLDGHYAEASEAAFKAVETLVRGKSGLSGETGANLMRKAFGTDKPRLKLNRLKSTSDKSEQEGYMQLFAGAVQAIRNPRAHKKLTDTPEDALRHLTIADELYRRALAAIRARAPRKTP